MHAFQSLCYLLLAVSAAAAPLNDALNQSETPALEVRDKTLVCKNTGGNIEISQNKAEGNIHAAPATKGGTKSGYPHEYKNLADGDKKNIVWPNKNCNAKDVTLLEFPVFKDGHLFEYDQKKPADKTKIGPVRGVFTYPHKDFCGVMAHTEKDNKGNFALCQ
ncbi:ribotoxin [Diplodia corticola]|uniref:Ribotoxin n=1 Tax=Diplodia corticola TaxID=236234 RepID=A0A1J9QXH5_9PEZI|nr:ribotoxin [Diplodia corticola]OJD33081.1 ribotoxin [Diplodia corticola]